MVIKRRLSIIITLLATLILISCANETKTGGNDREMQNIEVSTRVGVSAEAIGMKLPEVPELKWKFLTPEEREKITKYTGKMTIKVKFNENRKYSADIQLLDINNLPVTTENLTMDGVTGSEAVYTVDLHIAPELAKKVTKAKLVVGPLM